MGHTTVLYLRYQGGALHALQGKRFAKLKREICAGRGGPEVTALVESGYTGFLGHSGQIEEFEALTPTYFGKEK